MGDARARSLVADATDEELTSLRDVLRRRVQSEPTVEQASQAFAHKLYDELAGAAALVRMYIVLPAARLPPTELAFAESVARSRGGSMVTSLAPRTPVLTLLGTYGSEPAWCDRQRSVGHRAIPLVDTNFVEAMPMVARLLAELGADVGGVGDDAIFSRRLIGGFIGVFHVSEAADALDAQGRRIIPAVDFVREHGIRTVFGMGGAYLDGSIATCIVFAKDSFPRAQAERFASLISNFKLLTGPLLREGHIFKTPR